jgi:uncharacterized repeat protein (TIGR03803 family)
MRTNLVRRESWKRWLVGIIGVVASTSAWSKQARAEDPRQALYAGSGNSTTPTPGLIVGSDGAFYGTSEGFYKTNGVVFKLTSSGAYTAIYPFTSGQVLVNGVSEGPDGNLYGTIYSGVDPIAQGAVFKLTKAGVYTTLHAFVGADGANPSGPLLIASDGTIYGTTRNGGAGVGTGSGTVFMIDAAGVFSTLYDFATGDVTVYGKNPHSRLLFADDGTIYGTTVAGGAFDGGTVFAIAPDNSVSAVSLDSTIGTNPHDLVLACDKTLYGRAFGGNGVIFRLDPGTGALSILHALTAADGNFVFYAGDGNTMGGALIEGRNHSLYGVAQHGGLNGGGTIFELALDGTFTVIFGNGGAAAGPWGLVQGNDGNLFGTFAAGSGGVFGVTLPADERATGASCPTVPPGTGGGGVGGPGGGNGGLGGAGGDGAGGSNGGGVSGAGGSGGGSGGSGGPAGGTGGSDSGGKSGGCSYVGGSGAGSGGLAGLLLALGMLIGWARGRRARRGGASWMPVAVLAALVSGCAFRVMPPFMVANTPPPAPQPAPPPPPPAEVVVAQPEPVVAQVEAPPAEAPVAVEVAAEEATVYPTTPPPDPIPEYRPPAPAWDYVWINGYWDWTGVDWSWNSGYWVPRRAGVSYIAPRFIFVDGRIVYYRGYWMGSNGRREYGYGWRGTPPAAWRARPSMAPGAWRGEGHSGAWRSSPGAAAWRGPVRAEPMRGRPEGRAEPFRGGPGRMEPAGAHFGHAAEPMGHPAADERRTGAGAHSEAPHAEAGHPAPPAGGGWHGGEPHAAPSGGSGAPAANRAPAGPAAHAAPAAPPSAAKRPPAAPPAAPRAASGSRKK